jgi:glycosyltransferase involved in cell wall biosynthesis
MAAGVPIVAEATYAISEIVEDRHSALLAKPEQPRMLAGRITPLMADPQLAWKLRDTARHEAFSFFSRQRYCQALQGVYEQLVGGRAVEIPQIPITGGLRFSGRA